MNSPPTQVDGVEPRSARWRVSTSRMRVLSAGSLTGGAIDVLQPVDVLRDDAQVELGAGTAGELALEVPFERPAVRAAGERPLKAARWSSSVAAQVATSMCRSTSLPRRSPSMVPVSRRRTMTGCSTTRTAAPKSVLQLATASSNSRRRAATCPVRRRPDTVRSRPPSVPRTLAGARGGALAGERGRGASLVVGPDAQPVATQRYCQAAQSSSTASTSVSSRSKGAGALTASSTAREDRRRDAGSGAVPFRRSERGRSTIST